SEFGRRVAENGSNGAGHGTAGPVFLVGECVRSGLVGETPGLLDLDDGDLKGAVDFRRIYAAVLRGWLAPPPAPRPGGGVQTPAPVPKQVTRSDRWAPGSRDARAQAALAAEARREFLGRPLE